MADDTDRRARADYYIDVYGEVGADQHPQARRAQEIFERVRQTADVPIGLTPRLRVIDSDGKPWAIALPDGYIILSRGALDVCYRGGDIEVGDARLAFVLGHELAHLTGNDFWHRKVYMSLSGSGADDSALNRVKQLVADEVSASGSSSNWSDTIRRKELHADDTGFLYASLAGFNTNKILGESQEDEDFLTYWVKQTRTFSDELHFGPEIRTEFLRNRLQKLELRAEFFQTGVRLAHFGRYRDAQHFLEEFLRSFPAYEAITNLGYVHLHQGLGFLTSEQKSRYWLPSAMESVPKIFSPVRALGGEMPKQAIAHFREAERYLKKACDLRRDSAVCRINLATVYFYLGELYTARAVIEEARELAPENPDVLSLRALILNEQEKDIDMWPVVVRQLQKLAERDVTPAKYNLARLFEERGRTTEANEIWRKLLASGEVPEQYSTHLCSRQSLQPSCKRGSDAEQPIPRNLVDVDKMKLVQGLTSSSPPPGMENWRHSRWELGAMQVENHVSGDENVFTLVDGRLAVAALKLKKPMTESEILKTLGQPKRKSSIGPRTVWSYGTRWSAVSNNGRFDTIWTLGDI
ncbi:MAG: tetratricopeptide repeat protein [Thiotrichales bacterium]